MAYISSVNKKIDYSVSECCKIAQTDYKNCHNKVAAMLHWLWNVEEHQ